MTNPTALRAIAGLRLTAEQRTAALERARDVVVTSGAGCGKTTTLVARYISLLADGHTPRSILAVTFTEKAAREMRSRVRLAVNRLSTVSGSSEERDYWARLAFRLDSARIGTLHSLCAEILRAHPAEAGLDPRFTVLDEAQAALLRVQAVEDTLAEICELADFSPLLQAVELDSLRKILGTLLDQRSDALELSQVDRAPQVIGARYLTAQLGDEILAYAMDELRGMSPADLHCAGDKLEAQIVGLLLAWNSAQQALTRGELSNAAAALYDARRNWLKANIGKQGRCKELTREIQGRYDELLDPFIGGKDSKSVPPTAEDEEAFAVSQALVWRAFALLETRYSAALSQRQVLDFDDLESGAHNLLQQPDVLRRWQAEFSAILVDEFQDTNRRQRDIVEWIAGTPGRLFIVGDARQSIYRFRRADVTVFRGIQAYLRDRGGLPVDLDTSFRTHTALLDATGSLLAEVMGTEDDPARPYAVPYSPLKAIRPAPEQPICAPHIEFIVAAGANAEQGRPAAARALAARLLELRAEDQIRAWDEVALLFRASSGFSAYEDAFERSGIPFVTSAGRGMYDRPEIRDLLNMLRALADPADDLAMAGLLRSPAFGLSDAALYQLRFQTGQAAPYYQALQGDVSMLSSGDQAQAQRARHILAELLEMVDRVPVAELLQRLTLATDYRAILAVDDQTGSDSRLWRNLDKLISDAQASEQILVRDFLDYIAQLNDVSAREGEAPAEALGSVRLMTIHRAKGLEFPLVVLADAARKSPNTTSACLLLPEFGLTFQPKAPALLPSLAAYNNKLQEEAETRRLLYVALTRARDKLLISGHVTMA
ncbi:MAG: UvrD-helicase domain-containing protein, partial [Anaerolineae bacterium]